MKTARTQILVISQKGSVAEYIAKSFGTDLHSFEVEYSGSIREAAEAVARNKPDLILSEQHLPDGGVGDVLALYIDVSPVILLAECGQEKFAENAVKAGVIDYIVKSGAAFWNLPYLIEHSLLEWSQLCERKRLIGLLQQNEEQYLLESKHSCVMILHFRISGEILYRNSAFAKRHSCSRSHTSNIRIQDLWPAAALRTLEENSQILHNGMPVNLELEIRHREGHMIPMQVAVYLIASDSEPYLVAFHHGTNEQGYEFSGTPSSKAWGDAFDQVSDLIFIADEHGRITHINNAMANCLKRNKHEIIGHLCHEVIHGIDSELHCCSLKKQCQEGINGTLEIDGYVSGVHFKISVTPLHKTKGSKNSFVHIAHKHSQLIKES